MLLMSSCEASLVSLLLSFRAIQGTFRKVNNINTVQIYKKPSKNI